MLSVSFFLSILVCEFFNNKLKPILVPFQGETGIGIKISFFLNLRDLSSNSKVILLKTDLKNLEKLKTFF